MGLNKSKSLKITWIYFLVLKQALHMSSRMEILRQLSKQGHQISLITLGPSSKDYSRYSDIRILNIPIKYIPIVSPVIFGLILFLYLPLYIMKYQPDFIITDANTPFFSFIWKPILKKIANFNVIFDIRSTPVEASKIRNLNFKISVLWAIIMFDGITIITNGMKKKISQDFRINPDLIGVWSDGASTELFNYQRNLQYAVKLREKNRLLNKFIVIYHGVISLERGILECVKAMSLLKKEQPDIVLFLLGNGPAIPDIKKFIQTNELKNHVILHDQVDYENVPKYIAMSDVGTVPLPNLPIWRYQCPLKLLEYLAMEKPVIISDIYANREILQDCKCAVYISTCNYEHISRAIKYVYKNKDNMKLYGRLGKKIINEKYNWRTQGKILENYLLKIKTRARY